MANQEQVDRLKSNVEFWNAWRKKNWGIQIDLSGANLSGINLFGANLSGVNLFRSNLSGADLIGVNLTGADLDEADLSVADLSGANLSKANLSGANLRRAILFEANLRGANLQRVDLTRANLSEANLRNVDLSGVDLREFDLSKADLNGANLSGANLSGFNLNIFKLNGANLKGVNLRGADLSNADLHGFNLSRANLRRANLSEADLSRANLSEADLSSANLDKANLNEAHLVEANLSEANLIGAELGGANLLRSQVLATHLEATVLTGACLKDWNTNRFTDLARAQADYIYSDYEQGEFIDRRPHSGNFQPGEFAALFQQARDTLDLIFIDGIDWQVFFASFQELRQEYNEAELNIQAIEKKSSGSFVIRLEVNNHADKAKLQQSWEGIYEENQQLKAQISKNEGKLEAKEEEVSFYRRMMQGMSDNTQPVIHNNMQGAKIANMANVLKDNASQNYYSSEQRQSLAEAAQEIQALLDQLSKTYPTENVMQRAQLAAVAAEQAKANLSLWRRIVSAIDAGTIGAVGEMLSHPVATFFIDAAKDLAETKPQN